MTDMDKIKIDLLKEKYNLKHPRPRGFLFFPKVFIAGIIFAAVVGATFSSHIATNGDAENTAGFQTLSLFSTLRRLVTPGDRALKGAKNDRINFLLLGVGGEGHDGPELTDTIIFGSVRPSDKAVGLLSIPRDMTVPVPGEGWRKANTVNALAEANKKDSGPLFATQVFRNVFEQEIPYYMKVDFSGFAKLVDQLGGIDVYVDRAFTDDQYPTEDALTQTVSFEEGWQHMEGERALVYVRSRHGNNGEGSDFARSRRQQNILLAVKERVFTFRTLLNPSKISAVLDTLRGHIHTNMSGWEMLKLGNLLRDVEPSAIVNHVLDASEDSPLYATSVNGAYVLLPKNDDWSAIRRLAANVLTPDNAEGNDDVANAPTKPPRFVRIEIQNGTSVTGLAFRTSQLLEGHGFEVVKIGNAANRSFAHTVIYDLTEGARAEELKTLQDYLKADISMSASGWMFSTQIVPQEITVTDDLTETKTTEDDIDFLIILGESSTHVVMR
jgi:LCP family protein required for cell wall assembly